MLKIDIKIEIFTKLVPNGVMLMLLMVMIGILYVLINYKTNFSSKSVHCFLFVINIIIGKKGSSGFAADQNKIQILFFHLLLKLKELLSEETENQVLKFFFKNFVLALTTIQKVNSTGRKGNFLWRWVFLKFLNRWVVYHLHMYNMSTWVYSTTKG